VAGREATFGWLLHFWSPICAQTFTLTDSIFITELRKTPHRWVNLESLFQFLLPKNTIQEIKYFTALVSARPNDPSQPQRQPVGW
jgi:hypothetical protein